MKQIELPPRGLETLFGVHDQNIKYLETLLDVRIDARGQDVNIDGDPEDVETAQRILQDFSELFREGFPVGGIDFWDCGVYPATIGVIGTDLELETSDVRICYDFFLGKSDNTSNGLPARKAQGLTA